MITLFNTLLYEPLYNGLILLVSISPGVNMGLAIVVLTIIVKSLILPLSHKSVKTQAKIRELDPHIKEIKAKKMTDKQEEARQVMSLYKEHGVNPFSGCLLFLVQIPVIFALYWVFWKGISFNPEILYSYVTWPDGISMNFLGIDILGKSYVLALLAGVSQFFQIKLSMPIPKIIKDAPKSFKDELARSMSIQMRYVMPVIVTVVAYTISSAVALYWVTSNVFSVGHELIVKRNSRKITDAKEVVIVK